MALDEELRADLVLANRILAHEGVLDAFGHGSLRDPQNPERFWMSRSLAPAQVTAADILEYNLDCNPIEDTGYKSYFEKWIRGETYKIRLDVQAIVHSHSPTVVPFSATKVKMRPLLHNACFLCYGVPVCDSRPIKPDSDIMIGQQYLGAAMAEKFGKTAAALLLRGHGNVVVGPSLKAAVVRAYYTEINERQQKDAILLGGADVTYMTEEEGLAAERVMLDPAILDRPCQLWRRKLTASIIHEGATPPVAG